MSDSPVVPQSQLGDTTGVDTILHHADPVVLLQEATRLATLGEWIGTILYRLDWLDVEDAWRSPAGREFARHIAPVKASLERLQPQCADAAAIVAGAIEPLRTAQDELVVLAQARDDAAAAFAEAASEIESLDDLSPDSPDHQAPLRQAVSATDQRVREYWAHEETVAGKLGDVAERFSDSGAFDTFEGIERVTDWGPVPYFPFAGAVNAFAAAGVKVMGGGGESWGTIALNFGLGVLPGGAGKATKLARGVDDRAVAADKVRKSAEADRAAEAKRASGGKGSTAIPRRPREPVSYYDGTRGIGPRPTSAPTRITKKVINEITGVGDYLAAGTAMNTDLAAGMGRGGALVHLLHLGGRTVGVEKNTEQIGSDVKDVATRRQRAEQERKRTAKAQRAAKEKSTLPSDWPTCEDGKPK